MGDFNPCGVADAVYARAIEILQAEHPGSS
jgi:hypothetical protein